MAVRAGPTCSNKGQKGLKGVGSKVQGEWGSKGEEARLRWKVLRVVRGSQGHLDLPLSLEVGVPERSC